MFCKVWTQGQQYRHVLCVYVNMEEHLVYELVFTRCNYLLVRVLKWLDKVCYNLTLQRSQVCDLYCDLSQNNKWKHSFCKANWKEKNRNLKSSRSVGDTCRALESLLARRTDFLKSLWCCQATSGDSRKLLATAKK